MEDFNLPSPERAALLKSLHEALGETDVPKYFWACCQVCDLKALEKFIDHARISPEMVEIYAAQTSSMVVYWTQSLQGTSRSLSPNTPKKRNFGSSLDGSPLAKKQKITDSPSSSSSLNRNKTATALAKDRDGHCCVLTSAAGVEVAHIYPFCRLQGSDANMVETRKFFWKNLKIFWPKEKVAAWEADLFPRGLSDTGAESVDNLITLSTLAHLYWNRGAFALKPISINEDKTTLKIQFFWQRKQDIVENKINLLTTPLSTEGLDQNEGAYNSGDTDLAKRGTLLVSGQIFELKTDDPIKKPLPSFKLLELQWFLTRVVGMAGCPFPYESSEGDSDEDDPELDLDGGDAPSISVLTQPVSPEFLDKVNQHLEEN